jgi:hypothetical protein
MPDASTERSTGARRRRHHHASHLRRGIARDSDGAEVELQRHQASAVMQRFCCERCGTEVEFEASSCPVCGVQLGYVPEQRTLRALTPSDDGVSYALSDGEFARWRCLNAAWGCNWMVPAATGATWCRSCALTRGRPDDARPDAIDAWMQVEASKRRLVHQLDQIGLPIEPRTPAAPHGLVFDLVHVPGERGLTGHLDGVVTIDLTETDPVVRDQLRRTLGEPYRTLIGNLRHEIGHHYWRQLVAQSGHLPRFRALFGDERADYAPALERHYATPEAAWDQRRFVTRYAQAHPHEDWAETFAHHLHLLDLVDTARAHGLIEPGTATPTAPLTDESAMAPMLHRWRPLSRALDHLAAAVGSMPIYPFDPAGVVVDKLEFVHTTIRDLVGRGGRDDDPPGDTSDNDHDRSKRRAADGQQVTSPEPSEEVR